MNIKQAFRKPKGGPVRTRQYIRRALFESCMRDVNKANVVKKDREHRHKGEPDSYTLKRRDRRNLARAYAAATWKEFRMPD